MSQKTKANIGIRTGKNGVEVYAYDESGNEWVLPVVSVDIGRVGPGEKGFTRAVIETIGVKLG